MTEKDARRKQRRDARAKSRALYEWQSFHFKIMQPNNSPTSVMTLKMTLNQSGVSRKRTTDPEKCNASQTEICHTKREKMASLGCTETKRRSSNGDHRHTTIPSESLRKNRTSRRSSISCSTEGLIVEDDTNLSHVTLSIGNEVSEGRKENRRSRMLKSQSSSSLCHRGRRRSVLAPENPDRGHKHGGRRSERRRSMDHSSHALHEHDSFQPSILGGRDAIGSSEDNGEDELFLLNKACLGRIGLTVEGTIDINPSQVTLSLGDKTCNGRKDNIRSSTRKSESLSCLSKSEPSNSLVGDAVEGSNDTNQSQVTLSIGDKTSEGGKTTRRSHMRQSESSSRFCDRECRRSLVATENPEKDHGHGGRRSERRVLQMKRRNDSC